MEKSTIITTSAHLKETLNDVNYTIRAQRIRPFSGRKHTINTHFRRHIFLQVLFEAMVMQSVFSNAEFRFHKASTHFLHYIVRY